MAFSYTHIRTQQLDTQNKIIVRGYNTGSGVECNIYIKNTMSVTLSNQTQKISAESAHVNFFIQGATVASLTSDLPAQPSYPLYQEIPFDVLYSFNTDDGKNTKKYIAAADVTQGVMMCSWSKTVVKDVPEIAFGLSGYFIPGASISGTDIVGGSVVPEKMYEDYKVAGLGTNTFTLSATPRQNTSMQSGREVLGVFRYTAGSGGLRSIYNASPSQNYEYDMPASNQVRVVSQGGGEVFIIVFRA